MNTLERIGFINQCVGAVQGTGRSFNEALKIVKLTLSMDDKVIDVNNMQPQQENAEKPQEKKIGFQV